MFAELIFNKSLIRLLHILWHIAIQNKLWTLGWKLRNEFDFYNLAFVHGWRALLDNGQDDVIEFGCAKAG